MAELSVLPHLCNVVAVRHMRIKCGGCGTSE